MSLIKRLFFAVFACVGVICFSMPNAFGVAASACHTGGQYQYCPMGAIGWGNTCKTCPAGCYCPKRANPNTVACTAWTGLKCEAGVLKSNTNATQGQGSFGVYACPSDFPNSPEGKTSAEDCYVQCNPPGGKQKLPYKTIHCNPGEMLNFRQTQCVKCTGGKGASAHISEGEICPGGDYYPSCSKNQGIKKCEEGTKPNAEKTACIAQKVSCSGGMYLPKGETKCRGCPPTNVYCPGIKDVSVDKTKDQGVFNCDAGAKQAQDRQSCVLTSCPAGKYMANAQCNACPADFPNSPAGATSAEECYVQCSLSSTAQLNKILSTGVSVAEKGRALSLPNAKGSGLSKGGKSDLVVTPEISNKTTTTTKELVGGKAQTASASSIGEKLFNKKVHCAPGYGLRTGEVQCESCKNFGNYNVCTGGDFYPSCSENQGTQECKDGKVSNADRTACVSTEVKCSSGEYVSDKTCKKCPDRFTKSDDGATSDSQCYTLASDGKTKLYNKLIVVSAGQYLPKESMSPAKCPSGKVCKGSAGHGKPEGWGPRFGEYGDIGAYDCTNADEVPNSEQTACVKKEEPKKEEPKKEEPKTATCDPGYYLPSKSPACVSCLDGFACKGGTFLVKSGDQGMIECKSDTEIVSEDRSKCVIVAAKCKKGFYLKANEEICRGCDGINNYCPGGDFALAAEDQGIFECPSNSSVNSAKSGCKMTFTKDLMYYGPGYRTSNYRHQCWFTVDSEDYENCVIKNQK